jgi:hypothetical protein
MITPPARPPITLAQRTMAPRILQRSGHHDDQNFAERVRPQ